MSPFLIFAMVQAAALADTPEWRAELDLTAGGLDDPAELALHRVSSVTVDGSGRMYVAERGGSRVLVLDPSGEPVEELGGSGRGPGEFGLPAQLGWRGDTLTVFDSELSRLTSFLDGRVVGTVSFQASIPGGAIHGPFPPQQLLVDGTVHAAGLGGMRAITSGQADSVPHLRLSREGAILDTLTWRKGHDSYWMIEDPSGVVRVGGHPVFRSDLVRSDSRGRWIVRLQRANPCRGNGESPVVVTRLTAGGHIDFEVELLLPAPPITAGDVDAMVSDLVETFASGDPAYDRAEGRSAIEDTLSFPDCYPPVTRMRVALDGRTWLALHPLDQEEADVEWLILDPHGVPEGRVRLPSSFRLHESDGLHLWGIEEDDWGVERVARYRIEWS